MNGCDDVLSFNKRLLDMVERSSLLTVLSSRYQRTVAGISHESNFEWGGSSRSFSRNVCGTYFSGTRRIYQHKFNKFRVLGEKKKLNNIKRSKNRSEFKDMVPCIFLNWKSIVCFEIFLQNLPWTRSIEKRSIRTSPILIGEKLAKNSRDVLLH